MRNICRIGFTRERLAFTLALELGAGLDGSAAATISHRAVLVGDALTDWNHHHEQLCLPELSRSGAGNPAARRRVSRSDFCRAVCVRMQQTRADRPQVSASPRDGSVQHDRWAAVRRIFSSSVCGSAAFLQTWVFYVIAAQLVWMIDSAGSAAYIAGIGIGAISDRESVRTFCGYDSRAATRSNFKARMTARRGRPIPFVISRRIRERRQGSYAPYQPRFDWNLWFASLDSWQQNRFVIFAEERLLTGSPSVLALFAGNPFPSAPPAASADRRLAILVQRPDGKAAGALVATRTDRLVCAGARARA